MKTTELYISENGLRESSAKIVNKGTILYAMYGATSGQVGIAKITGAINQAILAIKPFGDYCSIFLMNWLKKEKENITSKYLQGGQGNLSGNIIKNLEIDITSFNEQRIIGEFFELLDNNITLHQRQQKLTKKLYFMYFNSNLINIS